MESRFHIPEGAPDLQPTSIRLPKALLERVKRFAGVHRRLMGKTAIGGTRMSRYQDRTV